MSLAMWTLSLMVFLQADAPWRERYPETASAIADASQLKPLFGGNDGPRKTVALLVSLAWFESRFNPDAKGDRGQSIGLFQISKTHAPAFILYEPHLASYHAIKLISNSFSICHKRPLNERLAWYAAGGDNCDSELAALKSSYRMKLAMRLYAEHSQE